MDELPPGFSIHSDGPGREVLVDEFNGEWAFVLPNRAEAVQLAWYYWREIYEPDLAHVRKGA